MHMKFALVLFVTLVILLHTTDSWRRRRRRRCVGCAWSSWGSYGSCSASCNWGTKYRYRSRQTGSCGAVCSGSSSDSASCYLGCCAVNCNWSWGSWGSCSGCGWSTRSRSVKIHQRAACGGRACPTTTTQSQRCNTGVCCPVNCRVSNWGGWGSCNAACEKVGQQKRTRTVSTQPSCGGTPCLPLVDTKSCQGGCCARDCTVSDWSSWGSCSAPPGKCAANAGTRSKTRKITRQASCGGKACPSLSVSGKCTPVPISCTVSNWSPFSKCAANSGNCGPGTQYHTRTITRSPYCSSPCPALKETRSCSAGCCPVKCVVSVWSAWTACSATCGNGTKSRTRKITTNPSCNGQSCDSLKETVPCSQYNNKNCVMSKWSSWSQCSNGCGNGMITKTRQVVSQAVCQGTRCGHTSASKVCTSYRDNRDCVVGLWGSWGACSTKCAVGTRQRKRSITVAQRCRGKQCQVLTETSNCGSANGGCQHVCNNGVCSCRPGYNLAADKRTCTAKNCGKASPRFCVQGTALGSTCKHALVTCPANKTTYPVTCSLGCPQHYSLKGSTTITCQTSGLWSSYSTTYCRRNNDPPTQIYLSGTSSVAENQPRGAKIGTFSSLDPVNTRDTHTYRIVKGGNGLFELKGADLLTLKSFNFEVSPNTFDVTVRSTDNGVPAMSLDKTFTIKVTDINESPTDIQLSSTSIDENSALDTTLGMLSTADPDKSQSFTYQLLNNAGGRFKVVNNFIKVAQSNKACLQSGGTHCILNYEQQTSHVIQVRSTDSGSPPKSIQRNFSISINDVNDQPRDLQLSNQTIKEDAPINSVIGQFSASDEDSGQGLVYSLDNDDNGRFKIDSKGQLLKANATDYEKNKVHIIVARVTDSGQPKMSMTKQFSIVVLDINEPPVSITLDNENVKENSIRGTKVATVTALDRDASQNLTFRLDDDAGGKFSLGNQPTCKHLTGTQCTTVLQVSGSLDFEDAQWEVIRIRVTDDKGKFVSQTFNVTIMDVNDRPTNLTLEGSLTGTVTENSRDIEIGELQTIDQDYGQTFTYTFLSNVTVTGNFEIRGNKLYVTKSANLDYEKKQSYQLSVRSTDSGNPQYSIEAILKISVRDENEAPVDITISKAQILENKPPGTIIGSISITDPDNLGPQGTQQKHACQLTDSSNGMIGISTSNGVNQLTVGTAGVNFEAKSIVGIIIQCSDPKGLSFQKPFNITVLDVNEAPTNIIISNNKVKENQAIPTVVGSVSVIDPDNEKTQRQTFKLEIVGSNSIPFAFQNGSLVATAKLDFESKSSWSFVVRAQDNGKPAMSKSISFKVLVQDTNDRPTGIQISSSLVDENSAQDTLIGTLSTVDQDVGQSYTYLCVDCGNGRFVIDKGELRVAQSNAQCLSQGGSWCKLNYETNKKFSIKIQSTDNGNPAYEVNSTIDVILRDVNDKPRDIKLSNNKVTENATINTLIGQFSARDEDAGQNLLFSLADDGNGRFRVDSLGKLYKANSTNYETQKKHRIAAVVTDNGKPTMKMEKAFIIEVLDVNDAPFSIQMTSTNGQVSFPTNTPRVKENSPLNTIIGTLVGLDPDLNQHLSFKLDDDASGQFVLDAQSKCLAVTNIQGYNTQCSTLLKLNGPLNYEKTKDFSIIVRVTDTHGSFTTQQLTVTVIDQNDPPTNITLSGSIVNENSNGALIGAFTTLDEDTSQSYMYSLIDDASGRFDVQGSKLYASSNANLDFENQTAYKITVQVKDTGSPPLNFTKGFSITVRDINEALTSFNLTNNFVMENSNPGTVIGSFGVRDPDNLGPNGTVQTHVCSVIGSQVGKFVVQSNVLKLGSAAVNFEQASIINVDIRCTDNGNPPLSLSKTVQVIVGDVNEAPSNISLSSNTIAENTSPSLVGTLSTTDPDNEFTTRQYFTYRMVGITSGLPFIIDGSALNTTRPLDYENTTSWTVTIQANDSGKPLKSVTNTFVISVVDVNEVPTIISLTHSTVPENSNKGTTIATLTTQDPDNNQRHTYTLTNTASGRFKIVQDKLQVAISNTNCLQYGGSFCVLNYEVQRQHTIHVRSTDSGVPHQIIDMSFTINVTDVNDQPRGLKLSGYSVMENATLGTKIGQFSATDEDAGQNLTYKLVDDDKGRFKMDKDNYLLKAKSTDYETSKTHIVTVEVQDNGSPSLKMTKNITINVNNINERPTNTTITSQDGQQTYPDDLPRVNENSPSGTTVGTLSSFDHDEVQTLTFTLVDDASGKFTVGTPVRCQNLTNTPGVKTKCAVPILVNGTLNYEKSRSEDIVVKVTDPSGSSHSQQFTIQVLDINDRPSDVTLSGGYVGYVNENANNALIGVLASMDEDANQTHTYRLINNGGWKFVVRGDKVSTSMYANLDFEKQDNYTIVVRSIDDGSPRQFTDKTFTIKVNDVNERPTNILLSNYSVPENSPLGLPVGKISVIDPDNNGPRGPWQVHACIVVNNVPFIVNQSESELIVAGSLNHETTPTIEVIVRCHDNGSTPLYLEKTITVGVADVNEAPTSIRLSGSTVAENSGAVVIGTLETIDPDNLITKVQTFTYAIIGDSGLPFAIDGNSLNTTRSLDYEAKSSWQITIQSTDNKGLSVSKKFIITVTDQNDVPSSLNITGPLSCTENNALGTYIGTVSTVDQDAGQRFTYSIESVLAEGHNIKRNDSTLLGIFSINPTSGIVTLSASLNYEQYTTYKLLVRSIDSGTPPLSVTGIMKIQVKDINEAPFNISLSNNTVSENSPLNTVVGDLFVHDPDNAVIPWQQFTCTVTNPSFTPFKVANHLRLVVAEEVLNYEKQNSYIVMINCVEINATNTSISAQFTIRLIDVNEAPYNLTITNTNIPENGKPGDVVGVINVLDPDTPGTSFANLTVAIQSQTPDASTFTIDGKSLVTTKPLDFETLSVYQVTLVVADSGIPPLKTELAIVVKVINMNDPPGNLTLTSSGIYENSTAGTIVGELNAVDQDKGQTCTFKVASSTSGLFSIHGTKRLILNSSLNYENSPYINVTISVTDNGKPSQTVELTVIVKVLDSNDPPSDIIMTSSSLSVVNNTRIMIPENTLGGTLLANMTVVDEDTSQGHICQLKEGQEYFDLRMASDSVAQVFVKTNADLDYESLNSANIAVTIQCMDSGSPPYSKKKSFIFEIQDVNEPPYSITLNGNHSVFENAPPGTVVGSLSCLDQDAGQAVSFSVVGSSSNVFECSPNKTLQVKNSSLLNYEATKSITVSILATDNAYKPLSTSRDFKIKILDINEAPSIAFKSEPVREGVSLGQCIATINATDPDHGQHVTLTLLSPVDTFALSDNCGNVSSNVSTLRYVTNRGPLSYDKTYPNHTYYILIQASDDGSPPRNHSETVKIHVKPIDPCDTKNDCNGNATCLRVNTTIHTCQCNPGFTGNGWNCSDIDECASNPCLFNNTICVNATNNQCQGRCIDYINNYTCVCAKGFTGSKGCYPFDHCHPNPCQNNGSCIPKIFEDSFRCDCMLGFAGENCSVNINDCAREPHPCNQNGNCTDGVNRFDCSCHEGFSGSQCQRNVADCKGNKCTDHEVCVLRDITQSSEKECFDKDFVIPIYFKPNVSSLEEVKSPRWKYQLQYFVKNNFTFFKRIITDNEEDDTKVRATDLYVVETSTISLDALNAKRVRKDSDGPVKHTAVYFVARYKDYGIPVERFYLALNETCLRIDKVGNSFEGKICNIAADMMTRLGIKPPQPRTGAREKDNTSLFGLHPYMYYVFAGLGGMILLLLIIGVALQRHKSNAKRRLRAFDTQRELLDNDTFPTDILERHQLSNEGQGDGACNPMYGVSSLDVQPTFSISDNPIYSRQDDLDDEKKQEAAGFTNPMYESFKPKREETKEEDSNEIPKPTEVDASTESFYQTPTPVNDEKKKKKKKGKKKKGKNEDDDNTMPDIASVNPMFASREIYTDQGNEDLYAVPKRNQPRSSVTALMTSQESGDHSDSNDTGNPIYATPNKGKKLDCASNPLYDSVEVLDEAEDDLPVDVVSAFGFSATKSIEGETGQSDC